MVARKEATTTRTDRGRKHTDPTEHETGGYIKSARMRARLTQEELADRLGDISPQQIAKYEKGTDRVSIPMLIRIAKECGVAPLSLLPKTITNIANSVDATGLHVRSEVHIRLLRAFDNINGDERRTRLLELAEAMQSCATVGQGDEV